MAAQPQIDLSAGLVSSGASTGSRNEQVDISAGLTPSGSGSKATSGLPALSKGMSDDDIIRAFGYDPAAIKKSALYRPGVLSARVDEGSYQGFKAEYQQRVRGGDTSTDFTRGAGNIAAAAALPGGGEAGLGRAAVARAGMAVLQPEINTDSYAATKGQEAAMGAVLGPAAALASRGVSQIAAKAVNASRRTLPPVSEYVGGLANRYGIRTTAGDISGSPFMQKVETQLENIPGVGMGKFRAAQQQEVKQAAQNLTDDMRQQLINTPFKGLDEVNKAATAGNKKAIALQQAIANSGDDWNTIIKTSGNVQAFRRKLIADQLYDRVGQLAGTADVPLPKTISAIQAAKADLEKAAIKDPSALKLVNGLENSLSAKKYQMVQNTPQGQIGSMNGGRTWEPMQQRTADTSFNGVRQLRSQLGSLISDYYQGKNAVTGSAGVGILQGIRNAVDNDLDSFAKNSGNPGLKQAWQRADAFYRSAVVPYKTTELAKALTDAPADEVFGKFIQAGKGGRAQRFYDALAVESQQVVDIETGSADGRRLVEASMRSVPVVEVRPWAEAVGSLG